MNKICPVSEYCGGCTYQGVTYQKQLEYKQEKADKLLSVFCMPEKIIGMKDPYHYRNKLQVSFAYDEKHRIICGNYLPESHFVVPFETCMIADELINKVLQSIRRIVISLKIPLYDENRGKGCLRHLMIRSSHDKEVMVVFITGSVSLPRKDELVERILKYNPEVKTIIHNINRTRGSRVIGDKNTVLYGKGYITDEICAKQFRISAPSFLQVNSRQTEILYRQAIDMAKLNKDEILLDAYCGIGTIGIIASDHVSKVIGVELNSSAIKDAKKNAQINHTDNITFVCDDASRYMDKIKNEKIHIDTVIMDPPRAGSDLRFMKAMVSLKPSKIIYISCNPLTLKEDLSFLNKFYKIEKIQPVDMFPFTDHVETVVSLSHK